MVMKNRPVDPGSITREPSVKIVKLSINHIVGLLIVHEHDIKIQ